MNRPLQKKQIEELVFGKRQSQRELDKAYGYDSNDELVNKNILYWKDDSQNTNVSSLSDVARNGQSVYDSSSNGITAHDIVATFQDAVGGNNSVAKFESTTSAGTNTKGKTYIMTRKCESCNKKSCTFCYECNETHCYPLRKSKGHVNDSCFMSHVRKSWKTKKKGAVEAD